MAGTVFLDDLLLGELLGIGFQGAKEGMMEMMFYPEGFWDVDFW